MFAVRRSLRIASARSFTALGKTNLAKAVVASSGFSLPVHRNMSTLEKVLKAEIKYEEKPENRELAEEYLQDKDEVMKTWDITLIPDKAEVKLIRTFKNEKVTVNYDVQNTADDIEPAEPVMEPEEDEEETDANYGMNFEVIVENAGGALRFDCAGSENTLNIRNVAYFEKYGEEAAIDGYTGPDFSQLDESLQEQFFNYLAERGIDDKLAGFIVSHAEEVETNLYVSWLKNVHKVVTK